MGAWVGVGAAIAAVGIMAADTKNKAKKLTNRQRAWIDQYFICNMNATEATARAWGAATRASAQAVGSRTLHNPIVAAEIQRRMEESAMSAAEALSRLADQARATFDDLLNDQGNFDLNRARELGKLNSVRRMVFDQRKGEIVIELVDAQHALELIGKAHKLFTDRVELYDWRQDAEEAGLNADALLETMTRQIEEQLIQVGDDASNDPGEDD